MLKANRTHILLLLIFTFSFIYRMLLMLWNNFPSGADIGLHNSIIYSITGSGNTNFLYNDYQMGGGMSLTFPGYHIFASGIILMTGMPEYIAQATIVSLFSSLIVLCAFLITKSVFNESAAYIVAFLTAISRFDIEMLLWGGYPNVITLMLIPATFYLYLQKDRFSLTPFLVSASILASSIFLAHSLSAAIYVFVTFLTVLLVFISPKAFGTSRKTGFYWLLPIFLGAALVGPFLANAIPDYLHQNSSFNVAGTQAINFAVLSTRILPLTLVLPLFLILPAFFLFSRRYNQKFVTLPVLLLSVWLFVPLFLTQGYLFGFIIDYNRFLYFIILPVIIFIGMLIEHGSTFFASVVDTYCALNSQLQKTKKTANKAAAWLSKHATHKAVYGVFILGFLLFSFFALPIFMSPQQGQTIQSFYQVMNDPGWQAIQWIKQNTPAHSVFVSDALYGWWLSGFAQRPTLSAVDPQYLTLAREFPLAKNASNLLDTDYLVDNGVIQVREDGGYIARHNPEILVDLNWTYFPYSFFTFDSDQNQLLYEVNGIAQSTYLNELSVKQMQMETATDAQGTIEQATITVTRGNDLFNCTQQTTIYRGQPFVNMTTTLDSTAPGVAFNWLLMSVQSKGTQIPYPDNRTVAMIDLGVKAFGQLIFGVNQPACNVRSDVNPNLIELQYSFAGKSQGQLEISASAYSVTDSPQYYTNQAAINQYFEPIIAGNLNGNQAHFNVDFKETFDYQAAIKDYDVSYIACRDSEMDPKFLRDPVFNLVFINSEVAIFKVKG